MTLDVNLLLQAAQQVAGSQQYPKGALYLVPTPIGNLADLSLRAVHVLSLVDAVACEDTRVSGGLLRHLGLDKPLMPLHQHNEQVAALQVLKRLQDGQRVAYVSDAGTPAISDPGAHLVQAAQAAGVRVVPLSGPSSVTTALSASGDAAAHGFRFEGFLPAKGAARLTRLREALGHDHSVVLFEAPHRIEALARELAEAAPQGRVTLCRELSKQFEDIVTLPTTELSAWVAADANRQRGEFVLVVHAQPPSDAPEGLAPGVEALLSELVRHVPVKQAAALVADVVGLSRKALYDDALRLRQALGED
ncbi:MAG: 16S rRNA (cytidine(1402)-2'-O)-methyltransferase [Burkholderiales bacterium]|nr:16S rRNA (cytidine(1402)-2'-O)-methyltransferase [Burkholderiales bacterium]MBH2015662.1 16S rRNA (cytidine(1402)-2'-O)-methyltransferase [Burkholderiales bacterium]